MYSEEKWKTYFSGAGYLTTGNFSRELAKMAEKTKMVPFDDCWIGILIDEMNKRFRKLEIRFDRKNHSVKIWRVLKHSAWE